MNNFKTLFSILILISIILPSFGQISVCANNRTPGENVPPGCLFCSRSVSGENLNFTPTDIPTNFSCGTIENNFFFSIRADSVGKIRLHILVTACSQLKGLEGVFYDKDFNEVSNCFLLSVAVPEVTEVTGLTPNEYYIFMMDGIDGDVCKYDILLRTDIEPYLDFSGVAETILFPDQDVLAICQGLEVDFSIPLVVGADFYDWKYPLFTEPISKQGNKIRLKFIRPFTRPENISVVPYSGCSAGESSPELLIQGVQPIRSSEFFNACNGRMPIEYKGLTFQSVFSSMSRTYKAASGCDSLVTYTPIPAEGELQTVDTAFCIGENFQFQGREFEEPGLYEFIGMPSHPFLCDTFIKMNLVRTGVLPFEIECVPDDFLNVLSFGWDKVPLAENYRIIINGDTAAIQSNVGYIHKPDFPGQRLDIVIEPYNSRGCHFEPGVISCFAPDLTALAEKDLSKQIQIFPNPSTGIFQISSFLKIEKIEVFDFSGRRILVEKSEEIDLTDETSGVYVFKIYTEHGVGVRRVFKK